MMSNIQKRVKDRIDLGFRRRRKSEVEKVFNCRMDPLTFLLRKEDLKPALEDLGIYMNDHISEELFYCMDMNNDGSLDFPEFSFAVARTSLLEQWVASLPLAQLLADALPVDKEKDLLNSLGEIGPLEIETACQGFCEGLKLLISEHVSNLQKALRAMEHRNASNVFQIVKMNGGNIDDFHQGLSGRIGRFDQKLMLSFFNIQ